MLKNSTSFFKLKKSNKPLLSKLLKYTSLSLFGYAMFKLNQSNKALLLNDGFGIKDSYVYDPLWRSKIRKSIFQDIKEKGLKKDEIMLISGTANPELVAEIADRLNIPLAKVSISKNEDQEIGISLIDNPEGKEVFIIQPISPPTNSNLMELLFLITEAKRAGATKVNAIIPFLGYSTVTSSLDHKTPIFSADIAKMLEIAGADSVSSLELHSGQIEGFYNIPFDNISSLLVITEYLYNSNLIQNFNNLMVISPDANGVRRAKDLSDLLAKKSGNHVNMAFTSSNNGINKESKNMNQDKENSENHKIINYKNYQEKVKKQNNHFVIGNVKGYDCIIIDDLINSGETLMKSAEELKRNGAKRVIAFSTHCK